MMTIINGDTTVTEKVITGDGTGSFEIFNDGKEMNFNFNAFPTDSLFEAMRQMFHGFGNEDLFKGFDFSFDTTFFNHFKVPFPDSLLKPLKQMPPLDPRDVHVKRKADARMVAVEDFSADNKVSPLSGQFMVVPNPSDGTFTISFPRHSKKESVLQISQADGNNTYKEIVSPGKADYQRRFDLRDYPSGIYIISLKQGKNAASRKMTIQ